MTSKITLSVDESEALHFDRLTKSLNIKKNELFRRAISLYEDYMLMNELDIRAKNAKDKSFSYAELEQFVNGD